MPIHHPNSDAITLSVRQWLKDVVIGLNLCPFASQPFQNNLIRIAVSDSRDDAELLQDLVAELETLANTPATELETTLLVLPEMLSDFFDYNQFLDQADQLLYGLGYEGTFQIASFHPDYQFAGTDADDTENLTNRSPYPILHLIREASLERVLQHYPNPESIPENNIERVNSLSDDEKQKLFPYLFAGHPH